MLAPILIGGGDRPKLISFYEVKGRLRGVNGIDLGVVTIWLHQSTDSNFRFITLIPD